VSAIKWKCISYLLIVTHYFRKYSLLHSRFYFCIRERSLNKMVFVSIYAMKAFQTVELYLDTFLTSLLDGCVCGQLYAQTASSAGTQNSVSR
jgi:hypothetical protein